MILATQYKLAATEKKLTATEKKFAATEKKLAAAKKRLETAEGGLSADREKPTITWLKHLIAKRQHTTAGHEDINDATIELKDATAKLKDVTTEQTHATAKLKDATTEQKHATAEHNFVTTLHDLATDCLRLSMHFFHPIQQCAQQVYHSALPLSPTSSQLHKSCLQSVIDNQLSHVVTFSGAPSTWGSLLRTIDVRPKQLTCIATSVHGIISACGNIVEVYNVVTGVLQQSLCAPESVVKIHLLPDGSIWFLVHSSSVTMWDMQTGGHIHTFSIQSKIGDIAVSATSIACVSSDGSVTYWDIFTKERGKSFGSGDPVVTIDWFSPQELVVVTQNTLSIHNVVTGGYSDTFPIPGCAREMICLDGEGRFLIRTSESSSGVDQEKSFFVTVNYTQLKFGPKELGLSELNGEFTHVWQSTAYSGQLSSPMVIQNKIACITPANGVLLFNASSNNWENSPPLLGAAVFVAMSNRNLVVQTKDSIQIFSTDVLASDETHDDVHLSHVYPLGENHIICILKSTRNLTLLKLETLQELNPGENISQLKSSLTDRPDFPCALFGCGLVAEFGVSKVVEMWQSGTPLPEQTEATEEDAPLRGWSPERTRVIKVYSSPRWELHVEDPIRGVTLASLPLESSDFDTGNIYDIIFDSETRFHLKIDGPGLHVQIPHDITASPSRDYSHTIIKGEPVPLSEPRAKPPYTLDANCEWVLDAKSRKVCWISPADIRRGNGGHFWAGLSLVMVGGDGVVRKVTFKDPDR